MPWYRRQGFAPFAKIEYALGRSRSAIGTATGTKRNDEEPIQILRCGATVVILSDKLDEEYEADDIHWPNCSRQGTSESARSSTVQFWAHGHGATPSVGPIETAVLR